MKRRSATRLLSLLLAVVMLFSLLSVMAFAEETEPADAQTEASADETGEQEQPAETPDPY